MKKLSLVTQSLITEFAYGLAFALVGVVRLVTDKGLTDGGKLGSIMTIDANFIIIAYGVIQMVESLYFIYLEKRGA
ncbi:MAG: hypothetical protein IJW63_08570 [Lachnospiraceae bacterium]|nr:hypothetical protein [Lachnospiraceae bacterium]